MFYTYTYKINFCGSYEVIKIIYIYKSIIIGGLILLIILIEIQFRIVIKTNIEK